jgi:hypothetical protein
VVEVEEAVVEVALVDRKFVLEVEVATVKDVVGVGVEMEEEVEEVEEEEVVVMLVDRKFALEVRVKAVKDVVEMAVAGVGVEVVLADHKLVLEVAVVEEWVVVLGVVRELVEELLFELEEGEVVATVVGVADRTGLPGLVVAVRVRWFLQQGPRSVPVHPTQEALAQQTLASREAREQQTYRRLPGLPFSAQCSSTSGCLVAERPVTQDCTFVQGFTL